ncbi:MAG: hypothetical protein WAO08_26425 [Hyphomicrobiaceae bacterium]
MSLAVQADTEYAATDNALTLYVKPDPGSAHETATQTHGGSATNGQTDIDDQVG